MGLRPKLFQRTMVPRVEQKCQKAVRLIVSIGVAMDEGQCCRNMDSVMNFCFGHVHTTPTSRGFFLVGCWTTTGHVCRLLRLSLQEYIPTQVSLAAVLTPLVLSLSIKRFRSFIVEFCCEKQSPPRICKSLNRGRKWCIKGLRAWSHQRELKGQEWCAVQE